MRSYACLALIGTLAAAPLQGQEYLDRGTFVLKRGDSETGRAEYAVRTTAGSRGTPGYLVVGSTRTPAREVQYILEVTNDLAPVSYQYTETTGGHVARRFSAVINGPRFSGRVTTEAGESVRELPARAPFAVIAPDDLTAVLFVPRPPSGESRTVNVVRLETMTASQASVTAEAEDSVRIAGHQVACRRFVLRLADGESRQFWVTATGSLLQVATPASGIIATRTEAPAR